MFDTAKWDVEFAQKYSDNEITALNFKNGKIYLAWGGAEIAVLNDRLKFLRTLKTGSSGTAQIDAIYATKDAIYAVVDKNQLIRLDEDPDNSADGGYAPRENSTANGQSLNKNSAPDGLHGISFHYGRINAVSLGANGLCVASWNGVACFSADLVATKFSGINAAPNRAAQGELNSVKFKRLYRHCACRLRRDAVCGRYRGGFYKFKKRRAQKRGLLDQIHRVRPRHAVYRY